MSDERFSVDALMAHESLVRGLARSVLRGDDRVDDVVQDTWSTALTHSPRDPSALARWLGTIARRLALKVKSRDRARLERESDERPVTGIPTPDEIVEREETRRRVLDALLKLPERHRDILLLRFYEDLPPREIAAQLAVPVETVRTRVKRAVAALRAELTKRYGEQRRALPLALLMLAKEPAKAAVPALIGLKAAIVIGLLATAGVVGIRAIDSEPAAPSGPQVPTVPPEEIYSAGPASVEKPETPSTPVSEKPSLPPVVEGRTNMVRIPAGTFTMGIDEAEIRKLVGSHYHLKGQDRDFWNWFLLTETPAHEVTTGEYLIDRYEVTNAEYKVFLDDACRRTVFTSRDCRTIPAVSKVVFGDVDDPWLAESIYWVNVEKLEGVKDRIFELNRPRIREMVDNFNEYRPARAKVKAFDEIPDRQRVPAWLDFELPAGIALTVYDRPIPDHWPKAKLTPALNDLPVVFVSARDAAAYAEWAGKHLPTEEEWEKAARGPKGFLFPWGDTWDPEKERNRLIWVGADSPPLPPHNDRPVDARSMPEGASPYGLHHMLGNVFEWTSSVPKLYPGSKAAKMAWFGSPNLRVVRSTSYGTGDESDGVEPLIRNTARVMSGAVGGISADRRFETIGFRCAKWPKPARDILEFRLGRDRIERRWDFALRRTVGTETTVAGVPGKTIAIGFVPLRSVPKKDPRILGYLYWNADLSLVTTEDAKPIPRHPDGFFVAVRDGAIVLIRPLSPFYESFCVVPGGVLRPAEDPDAPSRLEIEPSGVRIHLVIPTDPPQALDLPLTFTGKDLPDETWRR